jgi:RHS repeat-associated protein
VFGELTSVSYNDTTPNVSFTRDALGREIGRSDGAGSQTTAYNAYGEVTTEKFPLSTNSSATVSRTYDSVGRPKTILLKGTTAAVYTYDAATGRYATVKNNSATVTYSYLDKTNLPLVQTWQKGTSSAFLTVSNTYDAYNRLTLINANSSNQAAYVYDSLGRRTSATLQDDTAWHYTYNQRSEITSAIRKNASNVTQNNMRYVFDNIGNRTSSYEDATSKTYDANSLNQYTEIDVTGGSSVCPLYDDDGNMTQFDSSTYTYDAENRLVGAQSGTTRLEFIYDALGRRVARKLYLNNTLSKHHRYVYDGMKLLATYNAKSSFAKINSFLWQPFGLDVPLIMTYNSTVYGYLVDANKNVLGLFNPSKTRVATYLYGPFGQKLSESGTIAANNPLQFSSEQFDADLGLVYYNFRYYFPAIGKWLTKDPIGEKGGWNLYLMCGNNVVNLWDEKGEWIHIAIGAVVGAALAAVISFGAQETTSQIIAQTLAGAVGGAVGAAVLSVLLPLSAGGATLLSGAAGVGMTTGFFSSLSSSVTQEVVEMVLEPDSSPKKEFDFKSVALQTFFTGPITGAASGFFGRFLKDVEGDIFTVPVLSADIDIIGHDLSGLIFFFSDLLKQYLPTNNDRDNHQECPCD